MSQKPGKRHLSKKMSHSLSSRMSLNTHEGSLTYLRPRSPGQSEPSSTTPSKKTQETQKKAQNKPSSAQEKHKGEPPQSHPNKVSKSLPLPKKSLLLRLGIIPAPRRHINALQKNVKRTQNQPALLFIYDFSVFFAVFSTCSSTSQPPQALHLPGFIFHFISFLQSYRPQFHSKQGKYVDIITRVTGLPASASNVPDQITNPMFKKIKCIERN